MQAYQKLTHSSLLSHACFAISDLGFLGMAYQTAKLGMTEISNVRLGLPFISAWMRSYT